MSTLQGKYDLELKRSCRQNLEAKDVGFRRLWSTLTPALQKLSDTKQQLEEVLQMIRMEKEEFRCAQMPGFAKSVFLDAIADAAVDRIVQMFQNDQEIKIEGFRQAAEVMNQVRRVLREFQDGSFKCADSLLRNLLLAHEDQSLVVHRAVRNIIEKSHLRDFQQLGIALSELGMEEIAEEIFETDLIKTIQGKVLAEFENEGKEITLKDLKEWLDKKMALWLLLILDCSKQSTWRGKWLTELRQAFLRSTVPMLFDYIRDFSGENSILLDMQTCIDVLNSREDVAIQLKDAFERRLLHPGASTEDILKIYMLSVSALRIVDPSGLILAVSCEPVREYLRNRPDTMKCIISQFMNSGKNEEDESLHVNLLHHLKMGIRKKQESDLASSTSLEHQLSTWKPLKHGYPEEVLGSDLFSLLVNLFNSNDCFITEYRSALAHRLLANKRGFEVDEDLGNLELLKLKFANSAVGLNSCEIMLRDIQDSRRLLKTIYGSAFASDQSWFQCKVISKEYWPELAEEEIKVPEDVVKKMDWFNQEYCVLKDPRELKFKNNLGIVELDVCFDDGKEVTYKCSPPQAVLLLKFTESQKPLSIIDLCEKTGIAEDSVLRHMKYWQSQRVVQKLDSVQPITFQLCNVLEDDDGLNEDLNDIFEHQSFSSSLESARRDQLLESRILGFLPSFQGQPVSLSAPQLHNMLLMSLSLDGESAGASHFTLSERQLRNFLDQLVAQEKLEFVNGLYRRRR